MVLELTSPKVVELSKSKTLKNRVLMAPGEWNGIGYSAEEIKNAFHNTDWEDKEVCSLILDHADKPLSVHDWVGWVKNPRMVGDSLVGDLEFYDDGVFTKLTEAKMRCGISPKVRGEILDEEGAMKNFQFENFSVVINPACKKAYINLSQELSFEELGEEIDRAVAKIKSSLKKQHPGWSDKKIESTAWAIVKSRMKEDKEDKEMAKITGMEAERKKRGMTPAQFYAAPRDPPSSSALPIFDASHVRNALARFNQTSFKSAEEKAKALAKIKAAAKKFNIKINLKGGKMTEKGLDEEKKEESESSGEKEEEKQEVSEMSSIKKEIMELREMIVSLSQVIKKLQEESKEEPKEEKSEEKVSSEESKEESSEEKQEEMNEIKKLSKKVEELSARLDEPEAKSIVTKELSNNPTVFSKEETHHSPGIVGMADFLKKQFGQK